MRHTHARTHTRTHARTRARARAQIVRPDDHPAGVLPRARAYRSNIVVISYDVRACHINTGYRIIRIICWLSSCCVRLCGADRALSLPSVGRRIAANLHRARNVILMHIVQKICSSSNTGADRAAAEHPPLYRSEFTLHILYIYIYIYIYIYSYIFIYIHISRRRSGSC